jgi:hypothetical protein
MVIEEHTMNWSKVASTSKMTSANTAIEVPANEMWADRKQLPEVWDDSIRFWLLTHPPVVLRAGCCISCLDKLENKAGGWMHVIVGPQRIGGVHIGCQPAWSSRRRAEAIKALAVRVCVPMSDALQMPAELPKDFDKNEGK